MSTLFKAMSNRTLTENGAETHKSTLNDLLDFFYHSAAKRGQNIKQLFENALKEDKVNAIVAAFYLRNVRGLGQGERELFRQCLSVLSFAYPQTFIRLIPLIPEFGRWDDILDVSLFNADVRLEIVAFVHTQLNIDLKSENPSLLAKWMPSENASSKKTKKLAYFWINALSMSARDYRTVLTSLRSRIRIVESQMSANKWSDINYERVPSSASKLYRKAFGRHDYERYSKYLSAVEKGEKKINAGTLYPYDLVKQYITTSWGVVNTLDRTVEAQWRALPNYADSDKNALVMADVSGSMFSGTGSVAPILVSVSLAVYIAERNNGQFKNQFMTFSNAPELVTLKGDTLHAKMRGMNIGDAQNTNIQAAFDLILDTAKRYNLKQNDLPATLFIVSDMEFDSCGGRVTNFDVIKRKFDASGYEMPKLVFWNVNSRAMQTPITVNDKGVYLVSGCSPSIYQSAINTNAITAYDMMLEVLNNPLFDKVREAI